MITQNNPKVNKRDVFVLCFLNIRKMKETKNTFVDKNVRKNMLFDKRACGKLCGNCGKHKRIALFEREQTIVSVENFFCLCLEFNFSMLIYRIKKCRKMKENA